MIKYLQLFIICIFALFFNSGALNAQNGTKYPADKKKPEVLIYSSGKVEQFYVEAKHRLKAGAEPTAKFEVTYHDFSDGAKAAFEKAIELWSYLIRSSVTIKIDATWEPLGTGVLGAAGANSFRSNFKNAPYSSTWYPIAIANKLAGYDIEPDDYDIRARFSSTFSWYLGLDGNCPPNKYDFISIVMHEIGHGLGFLGSANVSGTQGSWGSGTKMPFVYDRFVFNGSDKLLIDTLSYLNPSAALKNQYTSNNVFFQSQLSDEATIGHVKLYAPSVWNSGSSYSHLDNIYNGTENSMMTYSVGTGEVTHSPGAITLGMFAEMGWINLLYKHNIIKDMESMTAPVLVETEIYGDSSIVDGSVYLHYSIDGFNTENIVPMSSSDKILFSASIPVQLANSVNYYFEATTSMNRKYYFPVQKNNPVVSIDSTFSFNISADTEAPVVENTPLSSIFNFEEDLVININANDNLGIDSVYIQYKINDGELISKKCDSIEYLNSNDLYLYNTAVHIADLQDGDTIYYRIVAVDLASSSNQTILPGSDFFKTAIIDLGIAVPELKISFDESSDAGIFDETGLKVYKPVGFSSKALHSPHPYAEGDPYPGDEVEYSAMLKVPIILKETDALIKFSEIVIVEPGEAGSLYGNSDFYDYVVVEGSKDSAKTWFPFDDGYDCRISSSFTTTYNNKGNGTEIMYKSHTIDLLGNPNLIGADHVLIRFRLWSDQLSAGWGWAIDNIVIQGDLTSVETNTLKQERFSIFPSPSKGIFEVLLTSNEQIKNYNVVIYNAIGNLVCKEEKQNTSNEVKHHVDITGNPPGMYFIKLNYNNKTISKKILLD